MKIIKLLAGPILALVFSSAAFATPNYEVPLSSVTVPSQCTATYTHAYVVPAGAVFNGGSTNDVVFAGDGSSIHSGAGDDCIVVGSRVSAHGEAGNDVLVSNGNQNTLDGGADRDTAYYHSQDSLKSIETAIQL